MTIDTLNRLASVPPCTDLRGLSKVTTGSVRGITRGLRALGLIDERTAAYLSMTSGALQLTTGVLGTLSVLQSRLNSKKAEETAEDSALVAANSLTPIGWAKIALAMSCSIGAGVAVEAVVKRIRADLSDPAGRADAVTKTMEAMT